MYVFAPFQFDAERLLLLKHGEPIPLGRRAALILSALLDKPGAIVSKDDLLAAAWPGAVVEESNLSVQVAHLRRLIGPQLIRTVERVGYQFVAPGRDAVDAPALSPAPPMVAVLSFATFDARTDTALGDSLAEDVITALAGFRSLKVVARTVSFQFDPRATDLRGAARAMGARYVLEGSVRSPGGRLRLTLQLIDGASGLHLWADSLDEKPDQSFGDHDELAGRAAAMTEAQVHLAEIGRAERERPESLEAYDVYLRGRRHVLSSMERDNAASYPLFSHGLGLLPDNVLLLSAMAEVIHHRQSVGWHQLGQYDDRACLEIVKRGMDRPDIDANSLALFANALHTAGEVELGDAASARAMAMNPNSPLVLVCGGLHRIWNGDADGAEVIFSRAVELTHRDPTQRFALSGLATVARLRGDWEEVLRFAWQAFAISPALSAANWNIAAASAHLGRIDAARSHYARYRESAPGVTLASVRRGQIYKYPAKLESLLEGLRLAGMPEN